MSGLRELQEGLQAHLLADDKKIKQFVVRPEQGNITERLAIYGTAYRLRLLDVLQKDYPLLKKLLGEDAFAELGDAYIDAYPSKNFSVNCFGQHLAEFLHQEEPYAQNLYLSELAHFIWALGSTITAADAPVLTTQEMAAIPQDLWPELRLKFQPALVVLTQEWNTIALWQALLNNEKLPKSTRQSEVSYCVVWRKAQQAYYVPLSKEEKWVMQMLQENQSFAEVCEGLTQWLPEEQVAQFTVGLLVRWINEGMLAEAKTT
jgi:hypothetical protein